VAKPLIQGAITDVHASRGAGSGRAGATCVHRDYKRRLGAVVRRGYRGAASGTQGGEHTRSEATVEKRTPYAVGRQRLRLEAAGRRDSLFGGGWPGVRGRFLLCADGPPPCCLIMAGRGCAQ
jgi:hypothetical protein